MRNVIIPIYASENYKFSPLEVVWVLETRETTEVIAAVSVMRGVEVMLFSGVGAVAVRAETEAEAVVEGPTLQLEY